MIPEEALEVAYAEASAIPQSVIRRVLEAAAPHLAAHTLGEAADVLGDLPVESMECYARYEEWKDALNVDHGIQAAVRWLHARAEFVKALHALGNEVA